MLNISNFIELSHKLVKEIERVLINIEHFELETIHDIPFTDNPNETNIKRLQQQET